ncbi:hypothetical protein [Marinimicrobium sp. C2-29]|uniref:hypothetical protein n=1 Tax=Marinimicrobium sp. C2-29 TaxID=3139825 RepID=UPI0031391525
MTARIPALALLSGCFFILFLTGCAQWRSAESMAWPDNLPPRERFEAMYYLDPANQKVQTKAQYLTWVRRFYNGWKLYGTGWNDLAPEVLSQVEDPQEREHLERLIQELGFNIAGEWSKDSDHNRISTRHLSIWGNALREAMIQGEEREVLEQVHRDVDNLLDRQLLAGDITASRYYPEDEDDVFR